MPQSAVHPTPDITSTIAMHSCAAQHVAVDHRRGSPERDARDGPHRVPPDAGGLVREVARRRREQASHGAVGDGQLGGLVYARRPAVVAEAAPGGEHVVGAGGREVLDRRPPLHPPVSVLDDDGHARLLQHDLGDPDIVRAPLQRPPQRVLVVKGCRVDPGLAPGHRPRLTDRVKPCEERTPTVGPGLGVEELRRVVRERVAACGWEAGLLESRRLDL
ncbi:hypothetical protein NHJ13734_009699 [Beauveria thailandica]